MDTAFIWLRCILDIALTIMAFYFMWTEVGLQLTLVGVFVYIVTVISTEIIHYNIDNK